MLIAKPSLFDPEAERYDQWFESVEGRSIFEIEQACIRGLLPSCEGRWLEVGVGSGRFAAVLGISDGLDPSSAMLALAAQRRIDLVRGIGEHLPYRDEAFDGILIVTTLCFVTNADKTLSECRRVLRPNGILTAGIVPAQSAWGLLYAAKGRDGHPLYSKAQFYTCRELVKICADAGLVLEKANSCLLRPPGETLRPDLEEGVNESAGFVAMRFRKT
jgi:ubiquinone/menaquinone biosynthesis C-methylase UbiE